MVFPIIALWNPFFASYFKLNSKIGWLFSNVEDMAKKILDISQNGNPEYEDQILAIKDLKEKLGIKAVAKKIKRIVENYGE